MSSLIAKEREVQDILDHLELYSKDVTTYNPSQLKTELTGVIAAWDNLIGKTDTFAKIVEPLISKLTDNDNAQLCFYIMKPLEFYMTALEEYVNLNYRMAVTRSGMFCERLVNVLILAINDEKIQSQVQGFENRVGRLQGDLSDLQYEQVLGFCNTLRTIYSYRNQKGPHDVPSADEILAKFALASCPYCYAQYAEVLDIKHPGIRLKMEEIVKLVNSVLWVKPLLARGKGGKKMDCGEAIEVLLFSNNFFKTEKTLGEITKKLLEFEYTFPPSTLADTLEKLSTSKDGFLWRKKNSKGYVYIQRLPVQEYYMKPQTV